MREETPLGGEQKALRRVEKALRGRATRLDLSGLGLVNFSHRLSDQFTRLMDLQVLYLNNNHLTAVPQVLGELQGLRILYLSENEIGEAQERDWQILAGLRSLERLAINHNRLVSVASTIDGLENLNRLHLDHNFITSLPGQIGRLSCLTTLDLQHNVLTTVPPSLGELRNLEELGLNNNNVIAIPESLGQLTALRRLYLNDNQLSALPNQLGNLTKLQELYLQRNRLTSIPDTLSSLKRLQTLHLHENRLTSVPKAITGMEWLVQLSLHHNNLSTFPDSACELPALRDLFLNDNQLSNISAQLAQVKTLKDVHLQNNRLTDLPVEISRMRWLWRLLLHGNPGLQLPAEILGPSLQEISNGKLPKAPSELLAYFFANREGSRPLNEAKLILVGQGAVGKTSLVRKLTTGTFNPKEDTTHGIKITDWECAVSHRDSVAVHIWDFGGQEMMHATHRFFLTTRSLYLLVLDRRLGEHDLQADYWFRMIRTYGGPEAPVVVVLNKQRQEPFDVNRRRWVELYGDGLSFVDTDCESDASIHALAEEIRNRLRTMRSVRAGFPKRWFAIKDAIADMRDDFIEYRSYQHLCSSRGVTDADDQFLLAGFLHDLGIALQYRDDPRLRFAYVLKPEWVTEGIYTLLHAPAASNGVLTLPQARTALSRQKYSDEAVDFLLGLLEKFELSFALNDQNRNILIPQLLPEQQPSEAEEFRAKTCLNFSYEYNVVAEGILPRFIVRTHHLSRSVERWKSGVILRHRSNCRALIRSEVAARQVRIHVTGPQNERRDLLAIIRHNFDVIHAEYGLDVSELVYPREAPETQLPVSELMTLRDAGESLRTVVVDGKVLRPEIAPILEDVEASASSPLKVFLSYSHEDAKHVDRLRKSLKLMERNGLIRAWYDREIVAGEVWSQSILRELGDADAIVCQLSPDFLASDFCVHVELEEAFNRHAAGEVALIAYVVRACGWKHIKQLSKFQLLPAEARPLREWRDPDRYWEAVADGIESALHKLQQNPRFLAKGRQLRLSSADR
jgi:internalin A